MRPNTRYISPEHAAQLERVTRNFLMLPSEVQETLVWFLTNAADKASPDYPAARRLFDRGQQMGAEAFIDEVSALYKNAHGDIQP